MLVLALVAFLGVIVPAVLGLALTGSKVTVPVVEDRRELYAASSAIDAALQLGVEDPDVGVPGGPCPDLVTTIDGIEVTVTCAQHAVPDDGCRYLDRFVTFVAEAREPSQAAVLGTVYADVVYRFDVAGSPAVEVRRWSSDDAVAATLSTTSLPPCSTTTTTTTTTIVTPTGSAFTVWEDPIGVELNNARWRGEATVLVTDELGAPLEGARVAVVFRYRLDGSSTWVSDTSIDFDTTVTGRATVYSPSYKATGNRVAEVEMTILGLTDVAGRTWIPAAHPLTVVVGRPA